MNSCTTTEYPQVNWLLIVIGLMMLVASGFMCLMGAIGGYTISNNFHNIDDSPGDIFATIIENSIFVIYKISNWVLIIGSICVIISGITTDDFIQHHKLRWRNWIKEQDYKNKYSDDRKIGEL